MCLWKLLVTDHGLRAVSRVRVSPVAVLVGESLEVIGLVGVHFFPETEQVEGGVWANLVLHACKEIRPSRPLDREPNAKRREGVPFFLYVHDLALNTHNFYAVFRKSHAN
jgi:hypothetical protein